MRKRKIKVAVVVGTRPEAIKMCPVIHELRRRDNAFASVVLITGQHREMLAQVFDLFKIEPDYDLRIMEEAQSLSLLTAKALSGIENVIRDERPEVVLVQGDTTTSFAAGLAAFYQDVVIGHVEAGLRTHKKYHPFPEEMNRKLIAALSDINFAPTRSAAENLIREGAAPNSIFVTGNTVVDALTHIKKSAAADRPTAHATGTRHILLTAHRRENFGRPIKNICRAVLALVSAYSDIEVNFPVHMNPHIRRVVNEMLSGVERVHLTEPVDYLECVTLMSRSYFILTDSGGIQEEAPSLGIPVLVLRDETERPEAVEAGTVRIVGTDTEEIVRHSRLLLDDESQHRQMAHSINPYGDGTASRQIVDILQSKFFVRPE